MIITHEGATVNSGHYTVFMKKSVFTMLPLQAEKELDWYKFDDDNVLEFSKKMTLYGEGTFLLHFSPFCFCSESFRGILIILIVVGDNPSACVLLYSSWSL